MPPFGLHWHWDRVDGRKNMEKPELKMFYITFGKCNNQGIDQIIPSKLSP